MASIENISVHVRVRPLSDQEKEKSGKAWKVDCNSLLQVDPGSGGPVNDVAPYTLDNVFDGESTTAQVYERTTRGLIKQIVEGFNSTVFAYGQTSSGKTHTMRGTADDPGLVPRAVKEIFDLINATKDREFLLRVSYMELYNEDINDLLAPQNSKLQVHESRESGVHVAGLREDIVSTPEQVLALLESGEAHRHVGETKMNKNSSRSHTIFRMIIESRSTTGDDGGAIRVSALTLVDLAGSERIAKTGAEGQRMKEGAAINKSLLTLGTVINKLSEGVVAAGGHIPYRDSKLTRILQPSLGGNAKTAIICAITPAAHHAEESHSTLRFACRAKRVVNNATVNEVLSDAAVLKRQANEIEELRRILQSSGNAGNTQIEAEISRLRAELLRKDQENDMMLDALAAEKEERERAQRKVDNMTKLMLGGGQGARSPGDDSKPKPKRDNRRTTWCPGAEQRKRPLLPNLGSLAEDAEDGGAPLKPGNGSTVAQRRSDGGALVTWGSNNSPPHKLQRSSTGTADADIGGRPSSAAVGGQNAESLAARVRELETANNLMQRELDAIAEGAQRTQKQLRDAEEELMSIAEERDSMGPALKEAQWKTRQLERELAEAMAERDAVAAAAADLEVVAQDAAAAKEVCGGEVLGQLQAATDEVARLKAALEEAESKALELEGVQAEKERLDEKLCTAKEAAREAEEKARLAVNEAAEALAAKGAAEERAEASDARNRELYEETQRLSSHISDLESRKRAPLYQKRQEDELRAAVDKATDADVRATDAEMRAKDCKTAQEAAEAEATTLREELDKVKRAGADEVADVKTEAAAAAQRATAEAERAAARHTEALADVQTAQKAAIAANFELGSALAQRDAEVARLQSEIAQLVESSTAMEAQLKETQECADAAAEHVKFLEEKAEQEAAIVEAEKKELEGAVEAARQEMAASTEAHVAALEAAALERVALAEVNTALEAAKSELEAKVATAAGAIRAAEDLKELRRKYKEETTRLNLAVKAASQGNKGTERAVDRATKDTERMRSQIKELEGKLRAAVADKSSAQLEKAAVERDLRTAQAQLDKVGKTMSRINGVEERKRESIMVGLNQTKGRLATVEENLEQAQVDLEKCQFELQAKQAECEAVAVELEEARQVGDDAGARADELAALLEASEADVAGLRHDLSVTRAELEERQAELETATEKFYGLENTVAELEDAKAMLLHEKSAVEADLEAARAELEATAQRLAGAEARLPEIDELRGQLEETKCEMEAAMAAANEADVAAKAHAEELATEVSALKTQIEELTATFTTEKESAETAATEAAAKVSALEASLEERTAYVSSLESQINDAMAEGMETKASADAAEAQCSALQTKLTAAEGEVETLRASVEQTTAELSVMRGEAAEAKAACEQLGAQLQESLSAAEELQAKLQETTAIGDASEHKVAALESRAAELEAEVEAIRTERQVAEAELQAQIQEAANSAVQWKDLAESLQNAQTTTEAAAAETAAAFQEAQARAVQLEASLAVAEAAVAEAEQRLASERDSLATRLSELEGDASAGVAAAAQADAALSEEREANESLRSTLAELQVQLEQQRAEWSQHVENLEAAHSERLVAANALAADRDAQLSSRVEALESEVQRANEEADALRQQVAQASRVAESSADIAHLEMRCSALEQELRKSRRREEKLQALQYRLREDVRTAGGDLASFDQLKDVRTLEYEMDRAANKASREKAALQAALAQAQAALKKGGGGAKLGNGTKAVALADKENQMVI